MRRDIRITKPVQTAAPADKTAISAQQFTIRGELSDAAIESLAGLLISLVQAETNHSLPENQAHELSFPLLFKGDDK